MHNNTSCHNQFKEDPRRVCWTNSVRSFRGKVTEWDRDSGEITIIKYWKIRCLAVGALISDTRKRAAKKDLGSTKCRSATRTSQRTKTQRPQSEPSQVSHPPTKNQCIRCCESIEMGDGLDAGAQGRHFGFHSVRLGSCLLNGGEVHEGRWSRFGEAANHLSFGSRPRHNIHGWGGLSSEESLFLSCLRTLPTLFDHLILIRWSISTVISN